MLWLSDNVAQAFASCRVWNLAWENPEPYLLARWLEALQGEDFPQGGRLLGGVLPVEPQAIPRHAPTPQAHSLPALGFEDQLQMSCRRRVRVFPFRLLS